MGDVDGALVDAKGAQVAHIHLSLSKLYEHSLKDVSRALHHAQLAAAGETPEEHRHRVARLERKLSRGGAAPSEMGE